MADAVDLLGESATSAPSDLLGEPAPVLAAAAPLNLGEHSDTSSSVAEPSQQANLLLPAAALDQGSASATAASTAGAAEDRPGIEVFEVSVGDASPVRGDSLEAVGEPTDDRSRSDDWYSQDDAQANKGLESETTEAADQAKPQVSAWASKIGFGQLGKKAGMLATAAKTAVIKEVKMVAEDVQDLRVGVREGAQITMQDTKTLSKQIQQDAKALSQKANTGWLGGLWRGGSKSGEESATTPAAAEAVTSTEASSTSSAEPTPPASSEAASEGADHEEALPPREVADDRRADASSASSSDGQVAPLPAGKDTLKAGIARDAAGAAAALKQSWSETAKASAMMWKDLREAKDEAISDFRIIGQEIRQGAATQVQKLRPASGAFDESCESSPQDNAEPRAESKGSASHGPTEAMDMLESGCFDDEEQPAVSRSDSRSSAERRYDESSAGVAQKMKESASATAAVAANVWRKTEMSIKKSLSGMPAPSPHAGDASDATGGFAFEPEGRGAEDERHTIELPSTRANYVELALPAEATPAVGRGPLPEATPAIAPEIGGSKPVAASAKAASGAATSARRLGDKIAKRSREVSGNLLKQARDLGNQAGAVAARQASRTPTNAGNPDEGDDGDDGVFEIGSDDEEELFAGEGDSEDTSSLPSSGISGSWATEPEKAPSAVPPSTSKPAAPAVPVDRAAMTAAVEAAISTPLDAAPAAQASTAAEIPAAVAPGAPAPMPARSAAGLVAAEDDWVSPTPLAAAPVTAPVAAPAKGASDDGFLAELAAPEASDDDEDWFKDLGDTAPAASTAAATDTAAAASADPVATATPAGSKDDFLLAAQKELDDLFGDD